MKEEQKTVAKQEEKTVENVVKVEAAEKAFPALPTIHFKRNSAVIDMIRYANELSRIVEALKEFPGGEGWYSWLHGSHWDRSCQLAIILETGRGFEGVPRKQGYPGSPDEHVRGG